MGGLLRALVAGTWLAVGAAYGGPAEGELFGYRLGDRYPVTPKTRGQLSFLGSLKIFAEKPDKPADLGKVEVITTVKTYTIANIYSRVEFSDEARAKALEERYADLLQTMYGATCLPQEKYLQETFKVLCGKQYELAVMRFRPTKPTGKHSVQVGLTLSHDSPAWKAMQAQFKTEIEQAEAEGKQYRLEQARKELKLKGLQ